MVEPDPHGHVTALNIKLSPRKSKAREEALELIAFGHFRVTKVSLKSHLCLRKTYREVAKWKLFAINASARYLYLTPLLNLY
jgi:hypothetical protein